MSRLYSSIGFELLPPTPLPSSSVPQTASPWLPSPVSTSLPLHSAPVFIPLKHQHLHIPHFPSCLWHQPFIVSWNIRGFGCKRYNVSLDALPFEGVATPAKDQPRPGRYRLGGVALMGEELQHYLPDFTQWRTSCKQTASCQCIRPQRKPSNTSNCYRYGWEKAGHTGRRPTESRGQNDELLWLWESSLGPRPVSLPAALVSLADSLKAAVMVRNGLQEARRVSALPGGSGTAPLFAYVQPVFLDQNRCFLSQITESLVLSGIIV